MTVIHGDCVEVMAGMDPESVDAIVTDPPYDLTGHRWDSIGQGPSAQQTPHVQGRGGFMGKAWDGTGIAFQRETWEAAYRVAKPSAYLLAFGGTRTVHRMTVALEDAGWIIRDMLVWAYASGFPKSKASLKPAWEPIVMARKPGPLRMLAIDECRIPSEAIVPFGGPAKSRGGILNGTGEPREQFEQSPLGRWPANVLLTDSIFDGEGEYHRSDCECPCHEDEAATSAYGSREFGCRRCTHWGRWDGVVGGGQADNQSGGAFPNPGLAWDDLPVVGRPPFGYGDSGTYSRFFLVPKAARTDREPVLGGLPLQATAAMRGNLVDGQRLAGNGSPIHTPIRANVHPTVKPTDLMRHLVRLVTPTGGTVLDPFLGSGTTALAAELEGFPWIGIEREAEYVAIAEARLNGTQRGLGLESA